MLTTQVLTQFDSTASHLPTADSGATKAQPDTHAATNAIGARQVAADHAAETVSLSSAALALQRGDSSSTPQALTYTIPGKSSHATSQASIASQQNTNPIPTDIAHRKLAEKLQAAGIATQPPFDFKVDAGSQHIQVLGNRPDAARIEQLINSDPALQQALSSSTASTTTSTKPNLTSSKATPTATGQTPQAQAARGTHSLGSAYQSTASTPKNSTILATV